RRVATKEPKIMASVMSSRPQNGHPSPISIVDITLFWDFSCGYSQSCSFQGISMTTDLFSLEGRVALITGGSRGIGKMIAKGFIDHGAKVYISSRKADACEATSRELSH